MATAATTAATNNPLLARFASNATVLVAPERQSEFEANLRQLVSVEHADKMLGEMAQSASNDDDFWPPADSWKAAYRPYIVKDGVLQIPVQGVLLNKLSYQIGSYATGYTYIAKALERGLADPFVRGIAFIVDSPGGEVAGNFELVDKIYEARGEKPLRAFAYDHAYSAAYSIASAADSVSVTRTGGVGSIGVVTMHVDFSGALEKAGIKITYIFAGKHKVDGNPYEQLPAGVKARIQKRIDKTYGIFVATVSRNRDLGEQEVRDTEAATFGAEEAIEIGLADSMAVFEDAFAAFADEVRTEAEEDEMSKTNGTDTALATITQATHDAAVATAKADGEKAGASAERSRINAILGCDAAKARPKAALSAALKTDMTVDQATAFLGDLPEEQVATAKGGEGEEDDEAAAGATAGVGKKIFEAAMNKSGNPEVGAGTDGNAAGQSDGDRIFSSFQAATGYTTKQK